MDNFGASRKSQHGLFEGIPASQTPEQDRKYPSSTLWAFNWPSSGIDSS